MRYWVPLVVAFVCLLAVSWVSPFVAWLLIILAFGLVLEVSTACFAKAGRTGNLTDHRQ
jgi:hypothetical protein